MAKLNYHDVYVTTAKFPRIALSSLPFSVELHCTRTAGWQLWQRGDGSMRKDVLLAGEYDDIWLVIDVAGHVILDSRTRKTQKPKDPPEWPGGWTGVVVAGEPRR